MSDIFKELFKPRSVITIIFDTTFCVLALMGKPIPLTLERIVLALMGVWFGEKIWSYAKNGGTK